MLIVAGELKGGAELKEKFENYVRLGGHLVLTSGNVEHFPDGIFDWNKTGSIKTFPKGSVVSCLNKKIIETEEFQVAELSLPVGAEVISTCNDQPLAIRKNYGKGSLTLLASAYGLNKDVLTNGTVRANIDEPLAEPFVLAGHVKAILSDVMARTAIFATNPGLSLVTCRKGKNEYTLAITNNTWEEKPFTIKSLRGKIQAIKELKTDDSERKAIGFLPENLKANAGEK